MTGEKAPKNGIELKTNFIEAPEKYSFSCGDLVIYPVNRSYDVLITFKRFQVGVKIAYFLNACHC